MGLECYYYCQKRHMRESTGSKFGGLNVGQNKYIKMTDAWYNVVHPIDLVLRCRWFDGVLCSAKNCRSVERDLVRMGIGKGLEQMGSNN